MVDRVSVESGKYTVVIGDRGELAALRHGEPWQDLTGNKLVYCLATELRNARQALAAAWGTLLAANESGLINDTIWHRESETLFDFLGNSLPDGMLPVAPDLPPEAVKAARAQIEPKHRSDEMQTPEQAWEWWRPIVCNEDGSINVEQLKLELCDASNFMGFAASVYDYATGGQCTKVNTLPSVVKSLIDDHVTQVCNENAPPDYATEINRLRNVIQAACLGGTDLMLQRWKVLFPDDPVPTVKVDKALVALRETQEACGVSQCPWCGVWGQSYAESERPADYCHHDRRLTPWRALWPSDQPAVDEYEEPTIVGQIRDFTEGLGASEDHRDIRAAFASLGLPAALVETIMRRIAGVALSNAEIDEILELLVPNYWAQGAVGQDSLRKAVRVAMGHDTLPRKPADSVEVVQRRAYGLVRELAQQGFVLTVEQIPLRPLAMGHYLTQVSVRPSRSTTPRRLSGQEPQHAHHPVLPRIHTGCRPCHARRPRPVRNRAALRLERPGPAGVDRRAVLPGSSGLRRLHAEDRRTCRLRSRPRGCRRSTRRSSSSTSIRRSPRRTGTSCGGCSRLTS